jgi:hypothetical protein
MGIKITNYIFNEVINSLDENGKIFVKKLHKQAISLEYISKISAMVEKADDWKYEYIRNKNLLDLFANRQEDIIKAWEREKRRRMPKRCYLNDYTG